MARVTVEDCVDKVTNRFELVLLAVHRARLIGNGSHVTIKPEDDKNGVIALREIAEKTISAGDMREWQGEVTDFGWAAHGFWKGTSWTLRGEWPTEIGRRECALPRCCAVVLVFGIDVSALKRGGAMVDVHSLRQRSKPERPRPKGSVHESAAAPTAAGAGEKNSTGVIKWLGRPHIG